MDLSFSLCRWAAFSPYHHHFPDWQQWAEEGLPKSAKPHQPPLDFIPAMQRRRLSASARLMFAALHNLDLPENTPLMFASHDGETNRSFALWLQLLREGAMSPMSFGLSVHNALSGSWSLHSGNRGEMNAIAANEAVLESALIEAVGRLAEGTKEVGVVVVEDPLLPEYDVQSAIRAPFPFALAMLIRAGGEYQLRFQGKGYGQAPGEYHGALDWISHHCQARTQWTNRYGNGDWQWQHVENA